MLEKVLNGPEWQERMGKKGQGFYLFLSEWSRQVERTVVIKESVPWQDIPGYSALMKSFAVDLKSKDVRHYPESLIQASCSLLRNEKLISTFVTIIYAKTR